MFMRKKMRDYLASIYNAELEPKLSSLLADKLITAKEADEIRKGKKDGRDVIKPTRWQYWNVHIDGLEYTHDLIVEREGVFKECVEAIKMAKALGYQVAPTPPFTRKRDQGNRADVRILFVDEVDGHTISPGYEYDAAKKDMVKRLHKQPEDFFLTRKMTREKFAKIQEWGERFTILARRFTRNFSPASAS